MNRYNAGLSIFAAFMLWVTLVVVIAAASHHPVKYMPREDQRPTIDRCDKELWDRVRGLCRS